MHTAVVMFGVIVYIIFALALISIITGAVWIAFPLKDKVYVGSIGLMEIYREYTPLGGRVTGIYISGLGIIGLALGFILDEIHTRLIRKFGART